MEIRIGGNTYTLTDKQAEFFTAPEKYVAYFGGVGNGKSFIGIVTCMFWVLSFPNNSWLIGRRSNKDTRKTIMADFMKIIPKDTVDSLNKYEGILTLKNKSVVYFSNLWDEEKETEQLLSLNLGGYVMEQAEQCPEKVHTDLNGRIRLVLPDLDLGNGEVIKFQRKGLMIGNPTNKGSWIYKRFMIDKNPLYKMISAPTDSNPFLPEDYKQDLLRSNPEWWLKKYYYGSWDDPSGLIYPEFSEEIHVVQGFKIPSNWLRFVVIDPGWSDPTAVLWIALSPYDEVWVYREYYKEGVRAKDVCHAIKSMSGDEPIMQYIIDGKGGTQTSKDTGKRLVDVYYENGIPCELSDNEINTGIERVGRLLNYRLKKEPNGLRDQWGRRLDLETKNKLFIFASCKNCIDEFYNYKWDDRRNEEMNSKNKPRDAHNHTLDDIRYFANAKYSYRMFDMDNYEYDERTDTTRHSSIVGG